MKKNTVKVFLGSWKKNFKKKSFKSKSRHKKNILKLFSSRASPEIDDTTLLFI